jgi:hypothetical protein
MIALSILLGGAIWLALYLWLGQIVAIAFAAACLVLVCIGAASDVLRSAQDRRTAYRRWRRWNG